VPRAQAIQTAKKVEVMDDARNFVLTAEPALGSHPRNEAARHQCHQPGCLYAEPAAAVSAVVVVPAAQFLVEEAGETCEAFLAGAVGSRCNRIHAAKRSTP
jgi:hypothetical protein